jgi:hypothetical protein
MVAITGNTYPVKDAIKSLGGRWNPDAKSWMVPDAKADAARKLVAGAPKSAYAPARSSSRYSSRRNRDHDTCNCDMCRSGSECLCRY